MAILRAKEGTYFSAGFHDESEDTIGSTSDSQTTHKLVSQRFTLSKVALLFTVERFGWVGEAFS